MLLTLRPPPPRPVTASTRRRFAPSTRPKGFTLVELMVCVAVLGVVVSLAAPSFAETIAANRLTTQTEALRGALSLARAEAVRRAQPVTLRSNDAETYSKGWSVFPDADANGAASSATDTADGLPLQVTAAFKGNGKTSRVTRSAGAAPFAYSAATGSDRIRVTFNSRGAVSSGDATFFRVCDSANSAVKGRIVQVNAVGKISLDATSVSCS